MSGMVAPSAIPGVRYGTTPAHADQRGTFLELWRGPDFPDQRFIQANLSTSVTGVLRGLHLHRHQDDLWIVGAGRAFVALVDVRPLLAASGAAGIAPATAATPPVVETRELAPGDWVVIPTGVAHGFLALDPLQLIYFVTNLYDGSDELGFAWDDPAVAVPWPAVPTSPEGRPVLSDRDRSNPSLADLLVRLRDTPL